MRSTHRKRRVALVSALALLISGLVATVSPSVSHADEGTNVALAANGGVATASGTEVSDGRWPVSAINDGDASTRWSSNTADDAWAQVQLAEATVIDHVRILWEDACAARYKLQVSNDGVSFIDASPEITPVCGQPYTHSLNEATAAVAWEYVRMQGLDRTPIGGTKYGMSLFELEVWDGPMAEPAPGLALVPLPQEVEELDAAPFVLDAQTRIEASGDGVAVAELLAERFRTSTGFALPVVPEASSNSIRFVLDDDFESLGGASPEEGYELTVGADAVVITAGTEHGLFNGTATLRQLFPAMIESTTAVNARWTAPAVQIADAPRFVHRGIQLDPARSFVEVDEVKAIIDTIASFKQSRFHFHLADDQGWRIEITNEGKEPGDPVDYTRLTEISGQSAMLSHQYAYQSELGRTGYYTQEEYRDIVAYAAERFVTVIPEIDVPGHTKAMLHAIPELNSAGSRPFPTVYGTTMEQNNGNVGESTLDVNNPQTWVSLRHIFGQVADMTPGEHIHIGGDESHVTPHDDYVEFVQKTIEIIRDLDKSAIGWSEIVESSSLTEGDVIQYWIGNVNRVSNAVAQGAKVVVSQANAAYLDMKYHPKTPIGLTWAGQGDLDHYYNWDPMNVIPNTEESDILGPEAPLWSETHRGGDQNEFLIFPRAISHAEVGWTPRDDRNLADFLTRMVDIGPRLAIMERNFYDGNKVTWGTQAAGTITEAGVAESARIEVAHLAAPGTKAAEDGTTIAVDDVDDEDSASRSALTEPLSATIDFGDGSAPVAGTFTSDSPRTPVAAAGLYRIGADHSYAAAGSYDVTVTLSDGRVLDATVVASADHEAPVLPVFDQCEAPTMELAATTMRDDSRVAVQLTGLEPSSYVDVIWDGAKYGTVRTDAEGNAFVSHYAPYQSVAGDHLLRVEDSLGRFVEKVITVDSQTQAPEGRQLTVASVTTSSEATNEPAPNGRAAALIDGDPTTYWHSRWSAPVATYDHWMAFDLGEVSEVSTIALTPRQGNTNGRFRTVNIEVSNDGSTWSNHQTDVQLSNSADTQQIPVEGLGSRHVRILITAPQEQGSNFAAAGEVAFWGLLPGEEPPAGPEPVVPEVWEPEEGCGPVDPEPTEGPTEEPTEGPTEGPTEEPTERPTEEPTAGPTGQPTSVPTTTVTVSPSATSTHFPATDVYSTPGYHDVNGRRWHTRCEPYSQTFRCFTDIWSTTVSHVNGTFVQQTGWHFNNLTYLPSPRSLWKSNPLGYPGSWVAADGRQWRTECDTATTGHNGCRSYIWMENLPSGSQNADGSWSYRLVNTWVFNNIVRFR